MTLFVVTYRDERSVKTIGECVKYRSRLCRSRSWTIELLIMMISSPLRMPWRGEISASQGLSLSLYLHVLLHCLFSPWTQSPVMNIHDTIQYQCQCQTKQALHVMSLDRRAFDESQPRNTPETHEERRRAFESVVQRDLPARWVWSSVPRWSHWMTKCRSRESNHRFEDIVSPWHVSGVRRPSPSYRSRRSFAKRIHINLHTQLERKTTDHLWIGLAHDHLEDRLFADGGCERAVRQGQITFRLLFGLVIIGKDFILQSTFQRWTLGSTPRCYASIETARSKGC